MEIKMLNLNFMKIQIYDPYCGKVVLEVVPIYHNNIVQWLIIIVLADKKLFCLFYGYTRECMYASKLNYSTWMDCLNIQQSNKLYAIPNNS